MRNRASALLVSGGANEWNEILCWFLFGWASLVVLTGVIAPATDRSVKAFVALAIFCTPFVSLAMLTALWLKGSASRRRLPEA
jgi:hypothetical protein